MSDLTQAEKDALGCRELTYEQELSEIISSVKDYPLTGYWYIDREIFDVKPISYWSSEKTEEE